MSTRLLFDGAKKNTNIPYRSQWSIWSPLRASKPRPAATFVGLSSLIDFNCFWVRESEAENESGDTAVRASLF
jgi:hypothetical protein